MSHVIETIAELLIPDAANARAWGKCHSSAPDPAGPLNMRRNVPPAELAEALPCWKRNGVPWPSGVLGCHLCCATRAAGALISTITTVSEEAWMAAAGRLQRSGVGIAYGLTSWGLRKMVWQVKLQSGSSFKYILYQITETITAKTSMLTWKLKWKELLLFFWLGVVFGRVGGREKTTHAQRMYNSSTPLSSLLSSWMYHLVLLGHLAIFTLTLLYFIYPNPLLFYQPRHP